MESKARNRMDIYRDRVALQLTGGVTPATAAGPGIGSGSTGGFALNYLVDGVEKKWFKWGRHSLDDPDAIFF